MKAIVAVDTKWGIGKKNDLLFILPADMKYFRETTLNKVVVMGSNTLKSFPGGKPLKNRTNIVLFPGGEKRDDCLVVDSLEELKQVILNQMGKLPKHIAKNILQSTVTKHKGKIKDDMMVLVIEYQRQGISQAKYAS